MDVLERAQLIKKQFRSNVDARLLAYAQVESILYSNQSPFQEIIIAQCAGEGSFGRALFLDGILQLSTVDECFYHEMIVHVPMNSLVNPKRALIIGGGDGGTLREMIKFSQLSEIHMVEIDQNVVSSCIEFMPTLNESGSVYRDPRVNLVFTDGGKFVREWDSSKGLFDLIVVDSSGHHGPGLGLFGNDFFLQCSRILGSNGILVAQSEAPALHSQVVRETVLNLRKAFRKAGCYVTSIPTFMSGFYTISWATNGKALKRIDPDLVAKNIRQNALPCKVYNFHLHYASFALPNWYRWLIRKTNE